MTEEVDGNPSEGTDIENISGAYFAQGTAAAHERGVLYQGDYQNEADGTGIAIRLHAKALAGSGVPVLLKSASGLVMTSKGVYEPLHIAGISDRVREDVGNLPNSSISKLYPAIRHFVVHKSEDISRRVMRGATGGLDDPETLIKLRKAAYGGTVLYSVWERDRVDAATVRELNRMGDNWVPCEQNAEMLRSCGVQRVSVVPHPFDTDSPLLKLTRRKPMEERRFYFIGRWEPRKNPVEILWAFCKTFRPGDQVHLTMKYHGAWVGYPSFQQTLEDILQEHPKWTKETLLQHVTPIEGHLRPDQILKLHFENNIYLGPSCGEAWCLPAFEAKIAGNMVIHTPYGGTADFCDEGDAALSYEMEEVPETYGWPKGSKWARPSQQELERILLGCSAPKSYARSPRFTSSYNSIAVGAQMRDRLIEIFGGTPGGEYLK